MRLSIGASRSRLIRQMLTECVLLPPLAGCSGLRWLSPVPSCCRSGHQPTAFLFRSTSPDARVLIFSVMVTMATGLLFGLAPALKSAHADPTSILKGSAQSISGREARCSLRKARVAVQVASPWSCLWAPACLCERGELQQLGPA